MDSIHSEKKWYIEPVMIGLMGLYLIISGVYLIAGKIHLDEGAYVYAARAVVQGNVPYRDFFFLQPPLHPYFYGLFQWICPGLLTARITSLLLGLIATGFLLRITHHLGNRGAALITAALIASNSFQLYFFSITRLYAFTSALLFTAAWFLIREIRPSVWSGSLAMGFLVLTVCTRITALPALILAGMYILFRGADNRARFIPLLVGIGVLTAICVPFVIMVGIDRLWFNLLGMNLSLHSGNLAANLHQKMQATSQLIRFYFLIWVMLIPIGLRYFRQLFTQPLHASIRNLGSPLGILWAIAMAILTGHSIAKIYQVSYQTIILPLIAGLVAVEWNRAIQSLTSENRSFLKGFFIAGCLLTLISYGRASIGIIDGQPALVALWKQAAFIREHTAPEEAIFSADSALVAAEADRDVLPGMAGSDLFAGWSTDMCRYYRVLNFDIMNDYIIQQDAPVLVYGDKSFSLSLPVLEPIPENTRKDFIELIDQYYTQVMVFPNLFIPDTMTYYLVRKDRL